ncbi:MAG: RNA methyltransferase [Winogradskyella sp.]
MLSKNRIKLIKSLSQKKYRQQHGLFTVEGIKGIQEFLNSEFELESIYTTADQFNAPQALTFEISSNDLKKISSLKTPNTALAVFKTSKPKTIHTDGLVVALDDIRDPGNLGTIIRLCDWYGIKDLVCSENTVDCYNSKVVQATMGSLSRVNISYLNLNLFLEETSAEIFGTFMDGQNIYRTSLPTSGIIVMGNEANGISKAITRKINTKLTIPQFGDQRDTESLNVANATAIVLSEFMRRTIEM